MSENTLVTGLYADQKNSKYGSFLKLSAKVADVIEFLKQHENEKGYVHMNVFQTRERKEGKNSHYCVLDTFKPDPNYNKQPEQTMSGGDSSDEGNSDDLPFN
jgi:hypothetical protein